MTFRTIGPSFAPLREILGKYIRQHELLFAAVRVKATLMRSTMRLWSDQRFAAIGQETDNTDFLGFLHKESTQVVAGMESF